MMFIVALCLGMAACGVSPSLGSASPTSTRNTGPAISCGSISQGGPVAQPANASAAENCFWQAYQQCKPATLEYTVSSVDTGTTHQLTLTPQTDGCRITDVSTHYVVPNTQKTTTYVCSGMTKLTQGLQLQGCGAEGNFKV